MEQADWFLLRGPSRSRYNHSIKDDASAGVDGHTSGETAQALSRERVRVVVRSYVFPDEIYEHTRQLDTPLAAYSIRRNRYIPIEKERATEGA